MTSLPTSKRVMEVVEATWPPYEITQCGPITIRNGRGGGKRVSAATAEGTVDLAAIVSAERAMQDLGQTCLFQIRVGDELLDDQLAGRGYKVVDPVTMYGAPARDIATEHPPRTAAIPAWEPLKIMEEIWEAGGIGAARRDVMHRAKGHKTGLISRRQDKPAGTAFLAMHGAIGMVHALEILPFQRRQGVGKYLMQKAAFWVLDQGGTTLSVICTSGNKAANGLYASLGMSIVGHYHYRQRPDT